MGLDRLSRNFCRGRPDRRADHRRDRCSPHLPGDRSLVSNGQCRCCRGAQHAVVGSGAGCAWLWRRTGDGGGPSNRRYRLSGLLATEGVCRRLHGLGGDEFRWTGAGWTAARGRRMAFRVCCPTAPHHSGSGRGLVHLAGDAPSTNGDQYRLGRGGSHLFGCRAPVGRRRSDRNSVVGERWFSGACRCRWGRLLVARRAGKRTNPCKSAHNPVPSRLGSPHRRTSNDCRTGR